ncbi:MAG: hypothetical protein EA427_16415 [Spirochaetaceae bacterium]|nr:MAG: hypothetical protein EA427_16415 [Spirochaetaceae bacterium]
MRELFFRPRTGGVRALVRVIAKLCAPAILNVLTALTALTVPIALVVLVVPAAGCTFVVPDSPGVTVLSWNIENLFDAIDQGTEYPEFTSGGGWTERDYQRRKQRIAEAVHALRPRPDILVFIEIENEEVLDALMDRYIVDINAPYRAFTKGPGAAIGIGIASRYPLVDVRTHLARSGEFPPLRPVLEAHLDVAGERLAIFANHWKSKRGGAPATEPLRRASARLLAARLEELRRSDPDLNLLVVGDFNERPREFELTGRSYPTALMPAEDVQYFADALRSGEQDELPSWVTACWLKNPDFLLLAPEAESARKHEEWFSGPVLVNLWDSSDTPGSFYFINRWERIDGIFAGASLFESPGLVFGSFLVPCPRDGCDAQGRPLSWEDDSRGVSDHLPLLLTLELHDE